MDNNFNEATKKHAAWPQPIKEEVASRALAEFCDGIGLDKLRESPCAVCSGLYPRDKWKIVSVEEIDLSLLKAPINLSATSVPYQTCLRTYHLAAPGRQTSEEISALSTSFDASLCIH